MDTQMRRNHRGHRGLDRETILACAIAAMLMTTLLLALFTWIIDWQMNASNVWKLIASFGILDFAIWVKLMFRNL